MDLAVAREVRLMQTASDEGRTVAQRVENGNNASESDEQNSCRFPSREKFEVGLDAPGRCAGHHGLCDGQCGEPRVRDHDSDVANATDEPRHSHRMAPD